MCRAGFPWLCVRGRGVFRSLCVPTHQYSPMAIVRDGGGGIPPELSAPGHFGAAWYAPQPRCFIVCVAVVWGFLRSALFRACGAYSWSSEGECRSSQG